MPKVAPSFGAVFSDHVFRMTYREGEWIEPVIEPYAGFSLDLGASVLHYAQTVFEGMKAFLGPDRKVQLFRPHDHGARFARSARKMCMPPIPERIFVAAVSKLVREDARWVRGNPEGALYIRPLMFADEAFLGVRPSRHYTFVIMTCPVGSYYGRGFSSARIWVEEEAARVAPGGIGEAKTGGNYAASLGSQVAAKQNGYDQVLWTDATTHEMVEEVGTMNVFFRFEDEVVTPALIGTILPGITRASTIQLLADQGITVKERTVTLKEVREGARSGRLLEVFGTGTAAVVSPVGTLGFKSGDVQVGSGEPGPMAKDLYRRLTDIQTGRVKDPHGWVVPITD